MSSATDVVVIGAGQSGLAAARALQARGIRPVVLEAGDRAAGSWPCYYDSLKAFSPARFNSMPGMRFPGDPDRYPAREEVADYLDKYAAALGADIRTGIRVAAVGEDDGKFVVVTADGRRVRAAGIVAASGSFSSPYRPAFPGQESFTGELTHVAGYRNPAPYAGKRVIVVGAGDSAAQVANELAPLARVTVAARHPLRFIPQRVSGRDVHHWLGETGFDALPAAWLDKIAGGSVITDSVGFQQTLADGLLDVRPMFAGLDGEHIVWNQHERERADAVILATGYRPSLGYLRDLGALDPGKHRPARGSPVQVRGGRARSWSRKLALLPRAAAARRTTHAAVPGLRLRRLLAASARTCTAWVRPRGCRRRCWPAWAAATRSRSLTCTKENASWTWVRAVASMCCCRPAGSGRPGSPTGWT